MRSSNSTTTTICHRARPSKHDPVALTKAQPLSGAHFSSRESRRLGLSSLGSFVGLQDFQLPRETPPARPRTHARCDPLCPSRVMQTETGTAAGELSTSVPPSLFVQTGRLSLRRHVHSVGDERAGVALLRR